jgi:hypothetical protein
MEETTMEIPATTPFDVLKQQNRMIVHLKHHRENLCGVEMLSDACLKYVSELYPAGDAHAGDTTRTAVALFAFSFTIGSWNSLAGSWMHLADVDLGFGNI